MNDRINLIYFSLAIMKI